MSLYLHHVCAATFKAILIMQTEQQTAQQRTERDLSFKSTGLRCVLFMFDPVSCSMLATALCQEWDILKLYDAMLFGVNSDVLGVLDSYYNSAIVCTAKGKARTFMILWTGINFQVCEALFRILAPSRDLLFSNVCVENEDLKYLRKVCFESDVFFCQNTINRRSCLHREDLALVSTFAVSWCCPLCYCVCESDRT